MMSVEAKVAANVTFSLEPSVLTRRSLNEEAGFLRQNSLNTASQNEVFYMASRLWDHTVR